MLMLPTLVAHPRVQLVAASDPREEARREFEREFGGRSHATFEAMCDDPNVDAVYIATPHELHAQHVVAAARRGKHALVEKPMAITMAECQSMVDAVGNAGVTLVIGHSHSFDLPFVRARRMIEEGTVGAVRMITAVNFTDFIYRPRRPEELDTSKGGGVVFSQGAHQVDVVRLLGGGLVRSVRAHTGKWDASRPTEGAYAAQLVFEDGTFASLVYSGYAHFDSDELVGWIGEMGHRKDPARYGARARCLRNGLSPAEEAALKNERAYGRMPRNAGAGGAQPVRMVIASCERADLRPMADGVMVYDDARAWRRRCPPPCVPARRGRSTSWCDAIDGASARHAIRRVGDGHLECASPFSNRRAAGAKSRSRTRWHCRRVRQRNSHADQGRERALVPRRGRRADGPADARHWQPVCLSEEVSEPTARRSRAKMFGERSSCFATPTVASA
jgi:phthalate 4,5-cis-dihydrodiol dehydrogenase